MVRRKMDTEKNRVKKDIVRLSTSGAVLFGVHGVWNVDVRSLHAILQSERVCIMRIIWRSDFYDS